MISHYRTLGVDPEADPVAIRSAYLALMRRYHPDRGGEEADPARAQSVTAAWEVLRDPGRRAAYDETRKAHFEPSGAALRGPKVRGGATGRNLVLLLVAATAGLSWWSLQQPWVVTPVKVVTPAVRSEPLRPIEPEIRPEADREAMHRRIAVDEQASPPPSELSAEEPIEVSPPEAQPEANRQAHPKPKREVTRPRKVVQAETTESSPVIDLAPLERHLGILTDQSLRFGTAAKRIRIEATREVFRARLRNCDNDLCRRDAYLRRNAEVGEIMRN